MKKCSVLSVTLVLLLGFGGAFASCGNNDDSASRPNNDPKTIIITGIPEIAGTRGLVEIGLFARLDYFPSYAAAGTSANHNNSLTFDLHRVGPGGYGPWTETGPYLLFLIGIDTPIGPPPDGYNFAEDYYYFYTGGKTFAELGITASDVIPEGWWLPQYNITSTVTTIDFSQFRKSEFKFGTEYIREFP